MPTRTYLEAVVEVLVEADRPLTSQEILEAALKRELIHPRTATPRKSLDAALYVSTLSEGSPVRRLFAPGVQRARWRSVRWTLAERL